MTSLSRLSLTVLAALGVLSLSVHAQEGFKFKSGVELVNVTATVTDANGRFITGLRKEDFVVYDDDVPQTITHFSNERAAVSLGILLDASGSMADGKMGFARTAINRFVSDLLGDDDELFLMEFSDIVTLTQDWTSDRSRVRSAVSRVTPVGGTALYDAIAQALPIAAVGRHSKKAILVISDGNDSDSRIAVRELRQAIRESEVLVYALGIDGAAPAPRGRTSPQPPQPRQPRTPVVIPFPGRPGGQRFPLQLGGWSINSSNGVNASALRQITDDTGGRTEIIREARELDAATARIADELSRQYLLTYSSPGLRDGRWHDIRVEVRDRSATVRARKGYVSS